jgi:ubiquitin C-terminal hydrolase
MGEAPARQELNAPRNSLLLKKPLQDVSLLLGYEDGIFDYVDHVSGALQNLGNTCYLNAMLHVLARIPSIRRWCARHQLQFGQDPGHSADCVLCALAFDLSHLAVDLTGESARPRTVLQRAAWSRGHFADFNQHDAHEAFSLLMDACEGIDATAASFLGLSELDNNGGTNSCRYSTPKWKAFGGIELSAVTCQACGHSEGQYQMWDCLSLAVPAQAVTVEQLLSNHWGAEPLRDRDDRCERPACMAPRRRVQEKHLKRWPNILALHLKRWRVVSVIPYHEEKVDTNVSFENVLLVNTEHPPYHLRGVVVHAGVAGGGHYVAYVRAPDNFWYFCNDWAPPRLSQIDEVLRAEAYLLFYEQ